MDIIEKKLSKMKNLPDPFMEEKYKTIKELETDN